MFSMCVALGMSDRPLRRHREIDEQRREGDNVEVAGCRRYALRNHARHTDDL
jgi:hypothetical protein